MNFTAYQRRTIKSLVIPGISTFIKPMDIHICCSTLLPSEPKSVFIRILLELMKGYCLFGDVEPNVYVYT